MKYIALVLFGLLAWACDRPVAPQKQEAPLVQSGTVHSRLGPLIGARGAGSQLWFADVLGWIGFVQLDSRVTVSGHFLLKPVTGIQIDGGKRLVFETPGNDPAFTFSGAELWRNESDRLRMPLVEVSATASGLRFTDRAGNAIAMSLAGVPGFIECGCVDIVEDQRQHGNDPNFHFFGDDRQQPFSDYDNCMLYADFTEPLFKMRTQAKNWCNDAYECISEDCREKTLLFNPDRPPTCNCIETGDGTFIPACQLFFADCCCEGPGGPPDMDEEDLSKPADLAPPVDLIDPFKDLMMEEPPT